MSSILRSTGLFLISGLWLIMATGLRPMNGGHTYEICLNPEHDHREDSLGCDASELIGSDASKLTCKHGQHIREKAHVILMDWFSQDYSAPESLFKVSFFRTFFQEAYYSSVLEGFPAEFLVPHNYRGPPVFNV